MNTSINFYQVNTTTPAGVDAVLPQLLEKALGAEHKVVIRCPSMERRDRLNQTLWSFEPTAFLPHGVAEDGHTEHQPIYVTADDARPNEASVLVVLSGALGQTPELSAVTGYKKVLEVFDTSDAQTKAARVRWKVWKEQSAELAYFAQSENGWQKKG